MLHTAYHYTVILTPRFMQVMEVIALIVVLILDLRIVKLNADQVSVQATKQFNTMDNAIHVHLDILLMLVKDIVCLWLQLQSSHHIIQPFNALLCKYLLLMEWDVRIVLLTLEHRA